MRILFLEPFFGGSHRSFVEGWQQNSRNEIEILGLPARRWKWRMRHSGIHFASEVCLKFQPNQFDRIVCSSMFPLAEWKGLVDSCWREIPVSLYFHENQLTYPVQDSSGKPDFQYGFTNIVSLFAADQIWFNSFFHLNSFYEAAENLLKRMPDFAPLDQLLIAKQKSKVYFPGIDFPNLPLVKTKDDSEPLTVLWPHRWEFDKDPQEFLVFLELLKSEGIDFRLILLGEKYSEVPESMAAIEEKFSDKIIHSGYAEDRQEYWRLVREADVAVSTAIHEFYGIAMLEAASQGVACLVPDRLSYSELFGKGCPEDRESNFSTGLYRGGAKEMVEKFRLWSEDRPSLNRVKNLCFEVARDHRVDFAADRLDQAAENLIRSAKPCQ